MIFAKEILAVKEGASLQERVEKYVGSHKKQFILQGIGFIVSGILSATLSGTTALHTELLIGVALLLTGIFQFVLTFTSKMHWWSFLSAGLSTSVGIVILWKPFPVFISLVTLLVVFMALEGLFEIFLALRFRQLRNWSWMIFSSVVTLTMAAVLWIGYPAFDVLYLGFFIAVNFVLYGVSLLMLVWKVAD